MKGAAADRDPASFVCWSEERVRFGDLDVLGHVNNVAFVVYFETGRVALMLQAGLFNLQGERNNVVAHCSIDYLREIPFPAVVRIGTRVSRVGRSSFEITGGLFVGEECVATTRAVFVRVNASTKRATPLNADERARLERCMTPVAQGVKS